ncbi:pyridoxal 5'-phosphate synthase glutaminase subunit PdxT [Candidatus Micrarchaeota archaeon]|nr:MAG: pyridoxal 5'-phosphate synthase glutaminase subunit PdxT [Candidatus Micrarchaeota archaeon]
MKVGVIGLQGDVEEHLTALEKCGAEPVWIRSVAELEQVDAFIIPGGESTTIGKLMWESGMSKVVKKKVAEEKFPVWGTCAGMILVASRGDVQVKRTGQRLLGLMDAEVDRNAFGRQRESFEVELNVAGIKRFNAVFIRAPAFERVGKSCKVLAKFDGKIVAAEQGSVLATAFHPELTDDLRLHEYFLANAKR